MAAQHLVEKHVSAPDLDLTVDGWCCR